MSAALALTLVTAACSAEGDSDGAQGGASGSAGSGGAAGSGASAGRSGTGGGAGSAGSGSGQGGAGGAGGATMGGAGGMAAGGSGGMTAGAGGAAGSPAGDAAVGGSGGALADAGPGSAPDAPPASMRPDAMGAPCATGSRYAFTVRSFPPQTGTFTVFFTATPTRAPTNSVIGLSNGARYLHDAYAAIVRFGTSGMLDARDDAGYRSLTLIRYRVTDYHFRLVVNVPAQTYSAYVSYDDMPEVPLGIDFKFRDTAADPTRLSHWGVEAIESHQMRVCGFLVL